MMICLRYNVDMDDFQELVHTRLQALPGGHGVGKITMDAYTTEDFLRFAEVTDGEAARGKTVPASEVLADLRDGAA